LLEVLARRKFAATERPRASAGVAPGSRGIPARVKRAVWRRDGGRCSFQGQQGRRCHERSFLEFDHVDPHGLGGEPTVDNVRLLCRAHNLHEAVLFYGPSAGPPPGREPTPRGPSHRPLWPDPG
jgi:5-methylcytosine-specific restriction endonuclease McrA